MREVRPGTILINAKGKQVKVTNVHFSMESSVMVQISQHCHASIAHTMLDTKRAERMQQNRGICGKTIVAAAEWYTRRRADTYRNSPMYDPLYQPCDPGSANFSTLLAHRTSARVATCGDSALKTISRYEVSTTITA